MFKIIILSQIGANGYQKHIFEILLLSPPWRAVYCDYDYDGKNKIHAPSFSPMYEVSMNTVYTFQKNR